MKPSGSFPHSISPAKDVVDYLLTRAPRIYLVVERFRHWVNLDKRLYLTAIKPGDVVLDIGANTGTHTVMFSHLVGRTGRVLAFEPIPENVQALRARLAQRARFDNVEIFHVAVSNPRNQDQSVVISTPGNDLTQASLKVQQGGSWEGAEDIGEYSCPVTGIDIEMSNRPLPRLDFVKIDIEGAELDAVRGATHTLSRHLPLIYCEVYEKWMDAFGYTSADLFAFARSLGYRGARVIREGKVHSVALEDYTLAGLFDVSADALFYAERHEATVSRFDAAVGGLRAG